MKIQQHFENVEQFVKKHFNLPKFKTIQLKNLVDPEKYCKPRIFLQRSVPIQPKTSEILPRSGNYPTGPRRAPRRRAPARRRRRSPGRPPTSRRRRPWRRRPSPSPLQMLANCASFGCIRTKPKKKILACYSLVTMFQESQTTSSSTLLTKFAGIGTDSK